MLREASRPRKPSHRNRDHGIAIILDLVVAAATSISAQLIRGPPRKQRSIASLLVIRGAFAENEKMVGAALIGLMKHVPKNAECLLLRIHRTPISFGN
jgi:hypothetical protein